MLSQFPHFTPLRDLEYRAVHEFVRERLPLSDFNASCLWSWDIEDQITACLLNGNLAIRFYDCSDGTHFYSFIGDENLDATAGALLDLSLSAQLEPVLHLIPETVAEKLDPAVFDVREDPDQSDYVLSADALSRYEGRRFASKRNDLRKFCAQYPDAVCDTISFDDPAIFQQCRGLFKDWQKTKAETSSSFSHREFEAFKRCIGLRENLDLFGIGLWIDGRLRAFSVCENGPNGYGFVHFEKADTAHYRGISAYLSQKVAIEFAKRGVQHLNIEQDLGIAGLRANKLSYSPSHMLKKYRVSRLGTALTPLAQQSLAIHYGERSLSFPT